MKNIVTATIHFSFKGINHSPSITIDLDQHLETNGDLPNLCQFIARKYNFDLYSYEYEMMQAEQISFSDAQGIITNFINDGILDVEAFKAAWHENRAVSKLSEIANQHLDISELSANPGLKDALFAAYQQGKLDGKKDKS